MGKDVAKNPANKKRCAFIYTPNGVSMPGEKDPDFKDWLWFPHGEGVNFSYTKVQEPLKPFHQNLLYIGGLSHPHSRDLLGHAAVDTWLTGGNIGGSTYKNSISIDQAAAAKYGEQTRFSSLALSCDGGVGFKSRVSTCSFNANGSAMPAECNPREIFERYFSANNGASKTARKVQLQQGKKVVDMIMANAKDLNRQLGKQDLMKMDEYLTSVNEIEENIKRTESWLDVPMKEFKADHLQLDIKQTAPKEYIRTMYDLIALAFDTDITRIVSYMLAREDGMGFGDKFPVITFKFKGHHGLSHDGDQGHFERQGIYDQFLIEQFAYFVEKLSKITDENGSILNSTMAMYGSSNSNTHNARNYPTVIAGGQKLGLKGGQFLKFDEKIPMSNLFVTLLNQLGAPTEKFADSTGALSDILA